MPTVTGRAVRIVRIVRIFRIVAATVTVLALGQIGCRGCDEPYQQYLGKMREREGVCYAMPAREAAAEVRTLLAEQQFPLPPETADDAGLIATGWKDTTVGASRLTFAGRPKRARREVFLGGGACLRFTVRVIIQSTPKEGPDYADIHFADSYEEGELTTAIHDRLQAHARPWQPPAP
jgi:hypothetical protein